MMYLNLWPENCLKNLSSILISDQDDDVIIIDNIIIASYSHLNFLKKDTCFKVYLYHKSLQSHLKRLYSDLWIKEIGTCQGSE